MIRDTKKNAPKEPDSTGASIYERDIDQWRQLVWHLVNRIRPRLPSCVSEEDLFSAGMEGLLTAARSYDPSRGAEFKTYAYHRVRGSILDELRRMDYLPRSQREKARRLGYEPPAVVGIPTDEDGQESLTAGEIEPACEQRDLQEVLDAAVQELPAKMRTVLILYYKENLRMREIGERMCLTESRVSQIHSNAVARLRWMLNPPSQSEE
ncbi:MAG: hypothetical protein DWQ01_19950 [Planctomycetota bacterium]|nr:MAG: hypothetical protein DWQ01_19950 [Planctomycetota bacterium]